MTGFVTCNFKDGRGYGGSDRDRICINGLLCKDPAHVQGLQRPKDTTRERAMQLSEECE
jgi:hypothetical protein